jgi:MFS family permease
VAAQDDALARLRAAGRARPALAAFAGIFAATLLGFFAVGAVLPVLPRYVRGPIGAGDVAVGVVVGAFAFTAVVGRPIGGRMADAAGRRRVVVAGLLITSMAGMLYLVPAGVPGLIVARLVLGIGDGWVFTAGATWIVDLAPESRRGQAIGMFGLAVWGGLAFGPVLGEAALALGGYDAVWVFAAVSPLLGALIARRVPDAHVPVPADRRERAPLLPRPVVAPGLALALANVGYGTMSGFVVLMLADRSISGGAGVFTAFAASVVGTRLLAGRLPDRLGPRVTAAAAGTAEALGLALLASAHSLEVALAGALVMGMGFSLLFPSLALIVVGRTGSTARGTSLGAFTAFFDVGVGLGAPLAGAVSAAAGYSAAFWTAAAAAAAGAVLGVVATRRDGPFLPGPGTWPPEGPA